VVDLSIYHLIRCSPTNVRQFTGVNEQCSFTPLNRPMKCSSWLQRPVLLVSGASSNRHQQFLLAGNSACLLVRSTGREIGRLSGAAALLIDHYITEYYCMCQVYLTKYKTVSIITWKWHINRLEIDNDLLQISILLLNTIFQVEK